MGTGAVYVTLSGLKEHSSALTVVETGFYFLNITLFLLNTITLLLQAIGAFLTFCHSPVLAHEVSAVFPRQALRLVQDPVKGVFVPLIVGDPLTRKLLLMY